MTGHNGTAPPPRVLGIGGSTRAPSASLSALRGVLQIASAAGAETALADVGALDLPLFDDRPLDAYPTSLTNLLADVRAADAFILCSPTYHATIAGGMKNTLDFLSFLHRDTPPYLRANPVALMAVGGANAANVVSQLRDCTAALNGLAIPTSVCLPVRTIDIEHQSILDDRIHQRMVRMIDELLAVASRLRQSPLVPHQIPIA